MFGNKEGKPVTIEIVEHTYIDGQLAEKGDVFKNVPADLAMELASAGKARIASSKAKPAEQPAA